MTPVTFRTGDLLVRSVLAYFPATPLLTRRFEIFQEIVNIDPLSVLFNLS